MKKARYFWIKERHNPQFEKPYFTALGRVPAKEARDHESKRLYGTNCVHKFASEKEYNEKIAELKAQGLMI